MKKLKLIYNPNSGDKAFKYDLDACVHELQRGGYETHIFRSMEFGDIENHMSKMDKDFYDTIVVSGGDGSINIVVSAMMKYDIHAKLGIIPSGTANDFATFLKIPKETDKAAAIISQGKTILSDIGLINDKYFVNVCGLGALANISQKVDENIKSTIGKLAYYIKGIEQVPNFQPMPVKITNSRDTFQEDVFLILILNSAGTGGFERLSPGASVQDGLFDFIAIKSTQLKDIAVLFLKILKCEYLDDSNIIFFRDNTIKIEPLSDTNTFETDLDGETGPSLPIEIKNIHGAIEIFVP